MLYALRYPQGGSQNMLTHAAATKNQNKILVHANTFCAETVCMAVHGKMGVFEVSRAIA
jgi:hypothetical protein